MIPHERFWAKAIPEPNTGCWLWTGCVLGCGYGRFRDGSRIVLAHRVAWEIAHGPIPSGLFVLHRCDVRWCVNPTHLFLGTHQDNMDDMTRKGRGHLRHSRGEKTAPYRRIGRVSKSAPGELNANARLSGAAVTAIRERLRAGAVPSALAREYGVSATTIRRIRARENWRHVP